MKTLLQSRWLLFSGLTALVVASGTVIIHSAAFARDPGLLSTAITLDFTLFIPALFYFLLVRRAEAPAIAILPVFVAGTVLAGLLLPSTHQSLLGYLELLLIATESVLFLFLMSKIRKVVRLFRVHQQVQPDFLHSLWLAMAEVMGKTRATAFVVGEFTALRYGLFFWWGRKEVHPGQTSFSQHRKSGYLLFASAFFGILLVETVVVHLLVSRWNAVVAIVLLALAAYTVVFLIGDMVAVLRRPIVIHNGNLYLRTGMRWNAVVPLSDIAKAEALSGWYKAKSDEELNASLVGAPTVRLQFRQPVEFKGYFGIRRCTGSIVLSVDDKHSFVSALQPIQ